MSPGSNGEAGSNERSSNGKTRDEELPAGVQEGEARPLKRSRRCQALCIRPMSSFMLTFAMSHRACVFIE